jgi:putative transposase
MREHQCRYHRNGDNARSRSFTFGCRSAIRYQEGCFQHKRDNVEDTSIGVPSTQNPHTDIMDQLIFLRDSGGNKPRSRQEIYRKPETHPARQSEDGMSSYKFRIYPTEEQKGVIEETFDSSRFVYNRFLAIKKEAYLRYLELKKADPDIKVESISYGKMSSMLTSMKADPQYPWLALADATALQQALKDLTRAFDNFFAKRSDYPSFKRKRDGHQSYRSQCSKGSVSVSYPVSAHMPGYIKLPKAGLVKAKLSRKVEGRILHATISRNPSGRYFVSIYTNAEPHRQPSAKHSVGIDVGTEKFYTDSDGNVVQNPRTLRKHAKKLARDQRSLSRKKEAANRFGRYLSDSKNYQKQKAKVARDHEKIANIREDFLQKQSDLLVKSSDIICAEDLNIKGLMKNHHLAKSIADISWSRFFQLLSYKLDWSGGTLVKVGRFFPSSQICSVCGVKNPITKDLSVREWDCPSCGAHHDRDKNAAINIHREGMRIYFLPK